MGTSYHNSSVEADIDFICKYTNTLLLVSIVGNGPLESVLALRKYASVYACTYKCMYVCACTYICMCV